MKAEILRALEPCGESPLIEKCKAFILQKQSEISDISHEFAGHTAVFLLGIAIRRLNLMRTYARLRFEILEIESRAKLQGANLPALRIEWHKKANQIARFKAHAPAIAADLDKYSADAYFVWNE